jgi:hypothetical protein
MEDQLGALGLVLNAVVLFNTRYLDAVLTRLRTDGVEVRDDDAARLSLFRHRHINMLGKYSFFLRARWPIPTLCTTSRTRTTNSAQASPTGRRAVMRSPQVLMAGTVGVVV